MKRFFSSRSKFNQDLGMLLLLIVILAGLFWRSFVPGSFLMGWDSVMSEFNLQLAFERTIGGVWQEFQGVGLQGGHGYVTDLVRLPWLWLFSLLMPLSLVRYVMVYLMWVLGMMGMYILARVLVKRPEIGFAGALIYGLHPFTVQNFFVIHDAFGWLFMCLPWSVWLLLSVLEKPARKKWLAWAGLQFFASFIGFIPPAFVGYGLTLAIISLTSKQWKRGILALVILGLANAYWLLPFGYYTLFGSNTYVHSKLNLMTTEHNALISESYGNGPDLILGKGFYFESLDWTGVETKPILEEWIAWWGQAGVSVGLVILAVLVGSGLIFGKSRFQRGFVMAYLLIAAILLFSGIFQHLPLLGQAFRIPFTKLSFEYLMLFSVFVILGVNFISGKFKRLGWVVFGLVLVVLGLISWPLINGRFFYDKMRVQIPNEYFQVMNYFRQQDLEQRIVVLPVPTYNGWYIQSWNYTGSGFLFYGIKQPILDRAFDVWSPYNETFYNELSTAFYHCSDDQVEGCAENVKHVFDKYQVSLALLDESVILPGQNEEIMRYKLWREVLASLDSEPDFESGFLSVYGVGNNTTGIRAPERCRQIEAETTYGRFDPYFSSQVTYIDGGDTSYPFSAISKENVTDLVEYSGDGLVKIRGSEVGGGKVTFPEFAEGEVWRGRIRVTLSGEELKIELLPFGQLVIGEQHLPLWLDQRLEVIQLPEVLESVVVQAGDKLKTIKRDNSDEIWDIPMIVGQGLSLRVFEGEGEQIVISTPSARLGQLPKDRLITVSGNERICLGYEQKNYQCLNQGQFLVTPQDGVYWFDALGPTERLPDIKIHSLIASYDFSGEMWQQVKREFEAGAGEVVFEMPAASREAGSWKPEAGTDNCDVLKRGIAKKSIVDGEVVYETADYGAYCDSWWMSPITEEGVLRLTGENGGGRGLKLSVFSTQENRTNLEQLLPSGGAFDQSYGFLTGLEQGSTINLETKSFGRIEGKNRLDTAKFYPVPLTWLQKIRIGGDMTVDNGLKIIETKKWGTGIYRVKVSGGGLVVLNQGFDKGWVSPGLKHVRTDGWANGWILKQVQDDEGSVWIFYWPQLFEWLGIGGLVIGAVVLILYTRTKN